MKKLISASLLLMSAALMQAQELNTTIRLNSAKKEDTPEFQVQFNSVSDVKFNATNFGVFGFSIVEGNSGLEWPRNSGNTYGSAGGFWFGAKKFYHDTNGIPAADKYCTASYDPSNGNFCFTPGKIKDDSEMSADKYKLYCSAYFNAADGTSNSSSSTTPWPNWITNADNPLEFAAKQNTNVNDISKRTNANYPLGPSFVSDEDFISVYHDTTLSRYTMGEDAARQKGYPMQLQVEERVYSWAKEELRDMVVLHYTVENKSNDTLAQCFFAPVYDIDLVNDEDNTGASNDRVRYYKESPELNLAVGWTMTNKGEAGKGFGYIGLTLLETPAINDTSYIRKNKTIYPQSEQIGLFSFRAWNSDQDIKNDEDMYYFISDDKGDDEGWRESDKGPGDKRMLMSVGPFTMLPGDKARFAVGLVFALPAKGGEADGTTADIAGANPSDPSLVNKVRALQKEYYKANTSGVSDESNSIIIINAVYPNPTAKALNVDYSVEQDADVRISIIDQFGTEMQVLYSGVRNAGKHTEQLQLDTDPISSGVYYLQVKIGNETKTKAISIVK